MHRYDCEEVTTKTRQRNRYDIPAARAHYLRNLQTLGFYHGLIDRHSSRVSWFVEQARCACAAYTHGRYGGRPMRQCDSMLPYAASPAFA